MKKVDSSEAYFASAKFMDCHDFASAKSRNDRNLFFQQDSRLASKVPNLNKQKILRFVGTRKMPKMCFLNTHAGGRIFDEKL